jgi:hypothetical protein
MVPSLSPLQASSPTCPLPSPMSCFLSIRHCRLAPTGFPRLHHHSLIRLQNSVDRPATHPGRGPFGAATRTNAPQVPIPPPIRSPVSFWAEADAVRYTYLPTCLPKPPVRLLAAAPVAWLGNNVDFPLRQDSTLPNPTSPPMISQASEL